MLYAIVICHRPHKCNVKYGRISALIHDASAIGADKFLAKEYVFSVIGSDEELIISGRVCNKLFLIIIDYTPLLKFITCFMM